MPVMESRCSGLYCSIEAVDWVCKFRAICFVDEGDWLGQMIFNSAAPAALSERNVQHEAYIHNLFWHSHVWAIAACMFTLLFHLSVCRFFSSVFGLNPIGVLDGCHFVP